MIKQPYIQVANILVLGFLSGATLTLHLGFLPLYLFSKSTPGLWIGVTVAAYTIGALLSRYIVGIERVKTASYKEQFGYSSAVLIVVGLGYLTFEQTAFWIVLRLLQGGATTIISATAYSWIGTFFHSEKSGFYMGLLGAAFSISIVFAPPLGVWLFEQQNGTTLLLLWTALSALMLILSLVVIGAPARSDKETDEEDNAKDYLVSHRSLMWLVIGLATSVAPLGMLEAFMPAIAMDFEVTNLGFLYFVFGVSLLIGRVFGGAISDKFGRLAVVYFCLTTHVVFYTVGFLSDDAATLFVITGVVGATIGALTSAIFARASDITPLPNQSVAMANVVISYDVGVASGSMIGGIMSEVGGPSLLFLSATILALVAFMPIAMSRVARTRLQAEGSV